MQIQQTQRSLKLLGNYIIHVLKYQDINFFGGFMHITSVILQVSPH